MPLIEELRKPKLFDIAVFDVLATLLAAYLVSSPMLPLVFMFPFFIALGIIVHRIMGTKTKLNFYLGLSEDPRPR